MATAFSHAFVALALGKAPQHPIMTPPVLLLGAVCSIVSDFDVIGFSFGIQYGDLWGHRGMTHSIFFAGLLSAAFIGLFYRDRSASTKVCLFAYFFLCTASHGVLDAMTDGGLGHRLLLSLRSHSVFFPHLTGRRLAYRHRRLPQWKRFSDLGQ